MSYVSSLVENIMNHHFRHTEVSVHKSRGDNVGAVEEMMCVVYVSVTKGS